MITFPIVIIYIVLASAMSEVLPPVDYKQISSESKPTVQMEIK